MIHMANSVERAIDEVLIYQECGLKGVIVENYHGSKNDVENTLKILSQMDINIEVGVNILPNEFKCSLELCRKYNGTFIQLDNVSGTYLTQRGGSKTLDVQSFFEERSKDSNIKVMGGVWPKYYQPIKESVLETDIEKALERADYIVVTGTGTGVQTDIDKIKKFRELCIDHPLIIGSGLDVWNVKEQLQFADGGIVGSAFKPYKRTMEKVNKDLVSEFMEKVKEL